MQKVKDFFQGVLFIGCLFVVPAIIEPLTDYIFYII